MGRNKRSGGAHTIQRAEELYQRSVDAGKPDFKYVALAIGAAPASPPTWAIWACIELSQDEERLSARGHPKNVSEVLDDLIRHFDRKQREFERLSPKTPGALDDYSPPSLRSAILDVLKDNGLCDGNAGSANDDWFRNIREAWDWEQKGVTASPGSMQLDGFKATPRIGRVLMQSVAAEQGDPEDAHVWAWITKCIAEQR